MFVVVGFFFIFCLGFSISKMKGLDCVNGKLYICLNTSLGNIGTVLFHHNYVVSSEPIRDHGLGVILLFHTLLNLTEDSFLTNE